ncbi:acyltransferase family protein [Psychromonas sp. GE-S-Ul-11]|uniref:acyltransferase family protein n=1 Tax=unclassified Psychromonas TaxID=2614957 RepID=UPI00390C8245
MINSIQYLRGIAAILVVYYHSTIKAVQNNITDASIFNVGESGVDLFFIISGFIICFVTDNKNFKVLNFLKSRVLRIIPLYWFFTLIALIAYFLVPTMVNSSGGKTLILESFFLIPTESKYLIQNGWTLSYEFYFYLICSFILVCRLNKIWLLTLLCLLPLISYLTPSSIYFFFDQFLLEFAMGTLSYIAYHKKVNSYLQISCLLAVLVLFLLLVNVAGLSNRFIIYGLPMWLIFHIGLLINNKLNVFELSILGKFLHNLGNSSYSLYLSHTFTLVVFNKIYLYFFGAGELFSYLLYLVVSSLIVGHLVFIYIETNLNKYAKSLFK